MSMDLEDQTSLLTDKDAAWQDFEARLNYERSEDNYCYVEFRRADEMLQAALESLVTAHYERTGVLLSANDDRFGAEARALAIEWGAYGLRGADE